MTSIDDRSAPAVYRLSRETWAELASGGGTRETISFLVGTQVSRRLWLLKVLVESSPPDLRPLPPVDVAWDVMDRAQALDPRSVMPTAGGSAQPDGGY